MLSQEEMSRFRDRDQRRLEERLAKGREKEEEERRKSKRLEKLKGQVRQLMPMSCFCSTTTLGHFPVPKSAL